MSTRTTRQGVTRNRQAVMRCLTSAMLCVLAAITVTEAWRTPHPLPVSPAAEAISTPVNASGPGSSLPGVPQTAPAPASELIRNLANIGNPWVDRWVQQFTTTLKSDVSAALSRGDAYLPMIRTKLAERQMPQELAYLPLIESDFNPQARSSASAVGLWQFMATTARQLGLSVSRNSDDRTNPAKATDAALTYLSQLRDRFGSWYLALAAYNGGPGTIANALQRVLRRSRGTDDDFYLIAPHLPAETREYVPKLIAVARIGNDPSRYGVAVG